MLVGYLQVDLVQTFLYLRVDMFSFEFLEMLLIQEAASILKNCGFSDVIKFLVGFRKTLPYHDEARLGMLQSRGMVDTLSELIVCFLAAAAYAAETAAKNMDSAPVFHFNYSVTDSNTTNTFVVFDALYGLTTCVGWLSSADLAPPPPPKRNSLEVALLFAFVAFVRVLCLFVENYLMTRSKANFDRIKAAVQVSVEIKVEAEAEAEVEVEVEVEANNSDAIGEGATLKRARTMSSVKGGATKVFFSIGPFFFAVSFVLALQSVFNGMAFWGGWRFGELVPRAN